MIFSTTAEVILYATFNREIGFIFFKNNIYIYLVMENKLVSLFLSYL